MGFCGGLRFFSLTFPAETETVSEGSCRKLCAVLQKIYGPFGASLCTSCDVDRRHCFLLLLRRLGKPLKLLLSTFAEFEDFSFYVPPTQRRVPNVFFWLDGRRPNLEDSRFCPCAAFCRWNDFVLTWGGKSCSKRLLFLGFSATGCRYTWRGSDRFPESGVLVWARDRQLYSGFSRATTILPWRIEIPRDFGEVFPRAGKGGRWLSHVISGFHCRETSMNGWACEMNWFLFSILLKHWQCLNE